VRRSGIPGIVGSDGLEEHDSLQRHPWHNPLALRTYQGHILRGALASHVASESEVQNNRRLEHTDIPIFVVPNPVDNPGGLLGDVDFSIRGNQARLVLSPLQECKGLDVRLDSGKALRPNGRELVLVDLIRPPLLQMNLSPIPH
jgi:hypothetical protein